MSNNYPIRFHQGLRNELLEFTGAIRASLEGREVLQIDLHCHDHNSNVPDELLGRILNVPETWLPTQKLVSTLTQHGMDAITITNHNNARSCYDLLDKGQDVLVGAEFSCMVPDYQVGIHVLTYGFDPAHEARLNKLRRNLYAFLDFTLEHNLPTIWAHPLYHYKASGTPPMSFFHRMALVFERFEVINGQRDTWQNMLVRRWVDQLTPERIQQLADETGLDPNRFCRNPFRKSMAGGSDSHMGIFSGLTGTFLEVPDVIQKQKSIPRSALALEAIREGRMAPFGAPNNHEKMMVTFLDYVCQIALYGKDPGLVRLLLHKGDTRQKVTALLVANSFAELRQHRITMNFIRLFHESLTGTKPHFAKKWLIPSSYKPIFDEVANMATTFKANPSGTTDAYSRSVFHVYNMLGDILTQRLTDKIESYRKKRGTNELDWVSVISNLEMPAVVRSYLDKPAKEPGGEKSVKIPDLAGFLDGLSFPFLTSAVILSAHYASARVMYSGRELLQEFSGELGYPGHPKRLLWLSDSWGDGSPVSELLSKYLNEVQIYNLPIDFMVCSPDLPDDEHLTVIRPQSTIALSLPGMREQNIPNFLEIHYRLLHGEYDRVICATEGVMGLLALYLKHAYSIPAFFYLVNNWKEESKKVMKSDKESRDRLFRLIRTFYQNFDSVFVTQEYQHKWLTSKKMSLKPEIVRHTEIWPSSVTQNPKIQTPSPEILDFLTASGLSP